jgi:hypothetical protein
VSSIPSRPGDASEPDNLRQVAQFLGDPQADIGRAGNERRVRMRFVKLRQTCDGRGRGKEAAVRADENILVVGDLLEAIRGFLFIFGEFIRTRCGTGI